MKRCIPLCLLVIGLVSVYAICAEPAKEDHTQSPHAEALALVFTTQQKVIAQVDAENWWHDVKERQWLVKRPFHPGFVDSTHLFDVTYRIDGKDAVSWLVDTGKKSVDRENVAEIKKEK